jgi:hypothetical protein
MTDPLVLSRNLILSDPSPPCVCASALCVVRCSWAGEKKEGKADAKAAAAPAKPNAPAPAPAAAEEDDADPFAEKPEKSPFEDEEELTAEEKEREAIIAAKAKKLNDERAAKGKKKEAGRSTLILDVKPYGDDTGTPRPAPLAFEFRFVRSVSDRLRCLALSPCTLQT